MKRPTESLPITAMLRREARAALKLSPWVLGSLFLVALLWRTDLAATGGLFQSVQPTPTSEPTLPPTATQQAPPSPTATTGVPSPTATTGVPSATATAQPPPATFTATPAGALTATLVPTNVPSATATATETPVVPTQTPVPPTATAVPTEAGPDDDQRYAQQDSNLLFDWSVLVDSVALGLSYVWLCCGVLVVLAIPVLFIALWMRSKRGQHGED